MTQEYPVDGDRLIVIETSSGDMKVDGKNVGSMQVPDGVEVRVKDGEHTLRVKSSRGGSKDICLVVPTHCSLLLRSASGDITVRNVTGQTSAKSMSGQITAHDLAGSLDATSTSGDVVVLASALDKLHLHTVSGDGIVETSLDAEGIYEMHSVSGTMTLRIPEDQGCHVNSRSVSGSLRCELPHDKDAVKRGRANADVNGGGPEVRMRTTSGDMRIKPAEVVGERQNRDDVPWQEPEPAFTANESVPDPFADRAPRDTHRLDEAEAEPFGVPDADQPSKSSGARRMEILKSIEDGGMTVSEGLAKLRALD